MVFDDAIVHYGNLRDFAGKMRVGVAFGRRAMGSPTGMGYPYFSMKILLLRQPAEFRDPARSAQAMQSAIHEREASGVIAAIFQAPQTLQQRGNDISPGDCAHYSTHRYFSSAAAAPKITGMNEVIA
jgi:hypothetical protein